MSVRILIGDVRERLRDLPEESVHCVVTSPPYWGIRDYGVDGQLGMEPTLGQHIETMVEVFREVRRVLRPDGSVWLNYGDCYATAPNGRSAADTKAAGKDDRTFRDKPFSTVGPIYDPDFTSRPRGKFKAADRQSRVEKNGRVVAGGTLKPKDLCMVPNRLAIALQDDGWWVRSEIVWGKPNGMPDSSGRYRPSTAHEKIWLLSKAGQMYYDAEAVRMPTTKTTRDRLAQDIEKQKGSDRANAGGKTNGPMRAVGRPEDRLLRNYEPDLSAIVTPEVWHIPTAGFSEAHFATFPPALVEPCIKAGCPEGGTVLDPFGGAGTTGLVADRLKRNAILIELNENYAVMAKRRIESDCGMFAEVELIQNGQNQQPLDLRQTTVSCHDDSTPSPLREAGGANE